MKALRLLFCLLLTLSIGSHANPASVAPPISHEIIEAAHQTTQHIQFRTILEAATCSGTAIGPSALLTATHCELGTDELLIEGARRPAHIANRIRDGYDHTILLLDGIGFDKYATLADAAPQAGDDVFIWGNPGHLSDLYRRGSVAGYQRPRGLAALFGGPTFTLYDLNCFHGDSGAAVFNTEGKIVGVISITDVQQAPDGDPSRIQLAGGLPLSFTKDQVAAAVKFVGAAPAPAPADEDN